MEENSSLFSLSIDPVTKSHLAETAKWARVVAIGGIIFLALVMARAAYTTNILNFERGREIDGAETAGQVIGLVLVLLIPLFPLIFILRYANAIKNALDGNDQELLNSSFKNLKIYFRYIGIVTIIFLAMIVLSFIIKLAGVAG